MNFLLDIAPLLVFFAAYKIGGIETAVISLMVSMPVCVGLMNFAKRKPSKINYYSIALVLFFGALTLSFDNSLFIQLKPTVLYVSMALALTVALFFKRNPIGAMLGHVLGDVPYATYAMLAWQWVGLLLALGGLNLAVVHYLSESSWVSFKTFFIPIFIILVFIAQTVMTGRKYGFAAQPQKQQ